MNRLDFFFVFAILAHHDEISLVKREYFKKYQNGIFPLVFIDRSVFNRIGSRHRTQVELANIFSAGFTLVVNNTTIT